MPLLEYRCKDCGHVTEVLTGSGGNEKPACEECGGKDTEKVFSSFSARVAPSAAASRCESCPNDTCPMR